jgi:uncharacterized membrane protein
MRPERLTAFSDGVVAIIITIMALELKAPHGDDFSALAALTPIFLSYVLSFAYVAIYWNNHHHLMHAAKRVTAAILWANMNLLFFMSLIPFATAWMGENHFSATPTAVYGVVLLMPAIAYKILQTAIVRAQGCDSELARALGHDVKGMISPLFYLVAIGCAFFATWIAHLIFVLVALMWIVPDRRIESMLTSRTQA